MTRVVAKHKGSTQGQVQHSKKRVAPKDVCYLLFFQQGKMYIFRVNTFRGAFGMLSDFRMYGAFPFGTIPFGELLRRRLRRRSSAIIPPPRPFARKSTKHSVPVGMAAHRR